MKSIITATMLTALTLTGTAVGQEPGKTEPVKAAVKGMSVEQLGDLLDGMGLSPRANKNKDGKVLGFYVAQPVKTGNATVYLSISGTGESTTIWMDTNIAVFGEKNPASANLLLTLLADQDNLWPAYMVYYPKTKILQLAQPIQNPNPNASKIRKTLDEFTGKCNMVIDGLAKAKDAEEKETGVVVK